MIDPLVNDLASLRVRLGLSQDVVAARAGVNRTTLNRWECGIYSPRLSHLRGWVAALKAELQLAVRDRADVKENAHGR